MTKRQTSNDPETFIDKNIDIIVSFIVAFVGIGLMIYGYHNPPTCWECFNYIFLIGLLMVVGSFCCGLTMLGEATDVVS